MIHKSKEVFELFKTHINIQGDEILSSVNSIAEPFPIIKTKNSRTILFIHDCNANIDSKISNIIKEKNVTELCLFVGDPRLLFYDINQTNLEIDLNNLTAIQNKN